MKNFLISIWKKRERERRIKHLLFLSLFFQDRLWYLGKRKAKNAFLWGRNSTWTSNSNTLHKKSVVFLFFFGSIFSCNKCPFTLPTKLVRKEQANKSKKKYSVTSWKRNFSCGVKFSFFAAPSRYLTTRKLFEEAFPSSSVRVVLRITSIALVSKTAFLSISIHKLFYLSSFQHALVRGNMVLNTVLRASADGKFRHLPPRFWLREISADFSRVCFSVDHKKWSGFLFVSEL